jgi:hypothetical protein
MAVRVPPMTTIVVWLSPPIANWVVPVNASQKTVGHGGAGAAAAVPAPRPPTNPAVTAAPTIAVPAALFAARLRAVTCARCPFGVSVLFTSSIPSRSGCWLRICASTDSGQCCAVAHHALRQTSNSTQHPHWANATFPQISFDRDSFRSQIATLPWRAVSKVTGCYQCCICVGKTTPWRIAVKVWRAPPLDCSVCLNSQ